MRRGGGHAFTLLEILVGLLILVVLASMAILGYQGYRDRAAALVDETNLQILLAASKMYAYDNNALPGSLSELRPEDFERAYALVSERRRPYTMLAHLVETWGKLSGPSVAQAQEYLPPRYYNQDLRVITCPSDPTPPTGFDAATGRPVPSSSYEIDDAVAGMSLQNFLANPEAVVFFEADDAGNQEFRHDGGNACLVVTAGGKKQKEDRRSLSGTPRRKH